MLQTACAAPEVPGHPSPGHTWLPQCGPAPRSQALDPQHLQCCGWSHLVQAAKCSYQGLDISYYLCWGEVVLDQPWLWCFGFIGFLCLCLVQPDLSVYFFLVLVFLGVCRWEFWHGLPVIKGIVRFVVFRSLQLCTGLWISLSLSFFSLSLWCCLPILSSVCLLVSLLELFPVLASPGDCATCPYHFSLRLFTEVRRSSYGPMAFPIQVIMHVYFTLSLQDYACSLIWVKGL